MLEERKRSTWATSAANRQRVEQQTLSRMEPGELRNYLLEQKTEEMRIRQEVYTLLEMSQRAPFAS